jgi:hypothetical protein
MKWFPLTVAQNPPGGQGPLIVEVSRSNSDKTHSIGILCTIDQTIPDKTQQSQGTDIHAPCGIRTRNPSMRSTIEQYLRPRGHWDGPLCANTQKEIKKKRYSNLQLSDQRIK